MAVLASACHQDIDIFEPLPLASGDIASFFAEARTSPAHYQWDAADEQVLVLPGKGQIVIPVNALVGLHGSPVAGAIEASLLEVRGKGDLIRNNLGTAAQGMLLESAGMLHLEIRQQGQPLRLAPGQAIQVQLPVQAHHPHLRVFSAEPAESGRLEWSEMSTGSEGPLEAVGIFDADSGQWLQGVEFAAARLGWLQCARYVESSTAGPAAVTTLKLPLGFAPENTAVFLVMQNMNTVAPFFDFAAGLPVVSREGLPAGFKAEFIVIAKGEKENYYFARQPIIITEHLSIEVVPRKASLPEILSALDGL